MVCSKIACGASLLVALFLSGCRDDPASTRMSFNDFVDQFNKTYANEAEKAEHEQIFNENMDKIDSSNNKGHDFILGVTEFTDISEDAFNAQYMSRLTAPPSLGNVSDHVVVNTRAALPTDWDWRSQSVVSSVKNQNPCGTCWSFAATGAIEGIVRITKKSRVVDLSNQEFQDCEDSGHSCSGADAGGHMYWAFQYTISNGVASYASYPFDNSLGRRKQRCRRGTTNRQVLAGAITGCKKVAATEEAMMDAVHSQPVAVALNARPLQHYTSGIITEYCSNKMTHAVLAVGYGTAGGRDYWLIKNSWGSSWGEKGYFRLVRGQNKCGVITDGWYPTM